jgi:hypothetical protein
MRFSNFNYIAEQDTTVILRKYFLRLLKTWEKPLQGGGGGIAGEGEERGRCSRRRYMK